MALVNLTGDSAHWGDKPMLTTSPVAYRTSLLLDASTERAAFVGVVWAPARPVGGTVAVRKVHFRCGAVTLNALSTFRVSLQDVSATAGPPYQPDGTPDQTYAYVGSGLTANSWNTTGNLSADRTVTIGSRIAVVFDYTTFTVADSIVISSLDSSVGAGNDARQGYGANPILYTGSWSLNNGSAVVALELDDGTFAFLEGAFPISALGTVSVSSSAAVRRAGARLRVPVEIKADGMWIYMAVPDSCDGSVILYDSDGTTALATAAIDNDGIQATSARYYFFRFTPVTLAANTTYRVAFVGGTTTAATLYTMDVADANLWGGMAIGPEMHYTEYDGSVWTETTTRRVIAGIMVSAIHDNSGGGGGGTLPVPGTTFAQGVQKL